MRGEILSFDHAAGAGWISGADGVRYGFTTADLGQAIPVTPGAKVDFVPAGTTATQIFPAPQPAFTGGSTSTMFSTVEPDPTGEPMLTYAGYFKKCLRKYADFDGRANRTEYWSFVGAYIGLYVVLFMLQMMFTVVLPIVFGVAGAAGGAAGHAVAGDAGASVAGAGGALVGVILFMVGMLVFLGVMAVSLGLFVPYLAVTARRLHDAGLTGWFTLALFVVSGVATIVIGILETQPGKNIYGGYTLPGGASPPPPPQPYATTPPPPQQPVA